MSENIGPGYINYFCHVCHNEINDAYEAMTDDQKKEVIVILTRLKKIIHETIKDYQSEITP